MRVAQQEITGRWDVDDAPGALRFAESEGRIIMRIGVFEVDALQPGKGGFEKLEMIPVDVAIRVGVAMGDVDAVAERRGLARMRRDVGAQFFAHRSNLGRHGGWLGQRGHRFGGHVWDAKLLSVGEQFAHRMDVATDAQFLVAHPVAQDGAWVRSGGVRAQ